MILQKVLRLSPVYKQSFGLYCEKKKAMGYNLLLKFYNYKMMKDQYTIEERKLILERFKEELHQEIQKDTTILKSILDTINKP